MRSKNAQMAQRIRELEQQLDREKRTSESSRSNYQAEMDQMKRQLQNSAAKESPRETSSQEVAKGQHDGTLYRVTGIRSGDTLNVRSGPGATYSVVVRLHNRVQFSVVGAAVTNEGDVWLPCVIEGISVESSTGLKQSLKDKGWVNSRYVERVPGQ